MDKLDCELYKKTADLPRGIWGKVSFFGTKGLINKLKDIFSNEKNSKYFECFKTSPFTLEVVNKGVNRIGNPRYKCKNCGRSYTKNAKLIHNEVRRRPPLSDSDKRKILMFKLNLGLSYPALAEHFNCSTYAIQQLVKEFHKGCRSEK